jgi:HPt (histidine-containing phosphotransfer) domain-containing protein
MDGYVSKPISREALFDAIEAVIPALRHPAETVAAPQPSVPGAPPRALINKDELADLLGGDAALLQRIASLFVAATPKKLMAMRAALDAQDSVSLYKLAHSLTGSVSNFSAEEALNVTRSLEQMAYGGDLSTAGAALTLVEDVIDRLQTELVEIVTTNGALVLNS